MDNVSICISSTLAFAALIKHGIQPARGTKGFLYFSGYNPFSREFKQKKLVAGVGSRKLRGRLAVVYVRIF